MPQLDTVSFFIQILSVFISFAFFYLLTLYKFLPAIALIIKSRNKFVKIISLKKNNLNTKINLKIEKFNIYLIKNTKNLISNIDIK